MTLADAPALGTGRQLGQARDRAADEVALGTEVRRLCLRDLDEDADAGGAAVVDRLKPPLVANVVDQARDHDTAVVARGVEELGMGTSGSFSRW